VPELVIPKSFKRVAKKKERHMQGAIARCLELLGDNPRHPGLQTHRVQGMPGVWEAYVDRANRVTFHYDGEKIVLRNNCNHDILNRP
jgi:mRNA-degrading endonuclease YafQ of YafQ-DinJ toxin-antitoxin module